MDESPTSNRASGYDGQTIAPKTRFAACCCGRHWMNEAGKRWYMIVDDEDHTRKEFPFAVMVSTDDVCLCPFLEGNTTNSSMYQHEKLEIDFAESWLIHSFGFRGSNTNLERHRPHLFGWLRNHVLPPELMRGDKSDPVMWAPKSVPWSKGTLIQAATPKERHEGEEKLRRAYDIKVANPLRAARDAETKAQWDADQDGPGGTAYREVREKRRKILEDSREAYPPDPDSRVAKRQKDHHDSRQSG